MWNNTIKQNTSKKTKNKKSTLGSDSKCLYLDSNLSDSQLFVWIIYIITFFSFYLGLRMWVLGPFYISDEKEKKK